MLRAAVVLALALPLGAWAQQTPGAQAPVAAQGTQPMQGVPGVSAQSVQAPAGGTMGTRPGAHALRISSGDLVEVGVFDVPELSAKLRVNEAGAIMIPVAGAVRVQGLTSDEAAAAVEAKLRGEDIVKDPHVTIFISEYATQGVTVTGEVKSPGIFPLLGSHGLVDLLSAAGGVTSNAGRIVSVTHKSDPEHPQMVKLDSRPGRVIEDVDIQPGDTIVVARAGVAYVVGDVGKPGGFLIEGNDRLTVLQVVALAGGTTRTSSQDKARLIRKTDNGREEMPIRLKAMMDGKVIDTPMEDGDILFVPSSKGKVYGYRGIDAAIALTTGLALGGKL